VSLSTSWIGVYDEEEAFASRRGRARDHGTDLRDQCPGAGRHPGWGLRLERLRLPARHPELPGHQPVQRVRLEVPVQRGLERGVLRRRPLPGVPARVRQLRVRQLHELQRPLLVVLPHLRSLQSRRGAVAVRPLRGRTARQFYGILIYMTRRQAKIMGGLCLFLSAFITYESFNYNFSRVASGEDANVWLSVFAFLTALGLVLAAVIFYLKAKMR